MDSDVYDLIEYHRLPEHDGSRWATYKSFYMVRCSEAEADQMRPPESDDWTVTKAIAKRATGDPVPVDLWCPKLPIEYSRVTVEYDWHVPATLLARVDGQFTTVDGRYLADVQAHLASSIERGEEPVMEQLGGPWSVIQFRSDDRVLAYLMPAGSPKLQKAAAA